MSSCASRFCSDLTLSAAFATFPRMAPTGRKCLLTMVSALADNHAHRTSSSSKDSETRASSRKNYDICVQAANQITSTGMHS